MNFLLKILVLYPLLLFPFESFEDARALIQWMVNGNYQKKPDLAVSRLYKLDEGFFSKLSQEVLDLISKYEPSYVVREDHLSYWTRPEGLITQFSLLNESGKLDDYSRDHDRSIKNKAFFLAESYPHIAQFISYFPHATNFRIHVLYGKSSFTQHQEDICFVHTQYIPAIRARFHLPIATQSEAKMFLQGYLYHFEPGIIYYFNNGCIHDGINFSENELRIHFVWDMLFTEDTYQRMFARSVFSPWMEKIDETGLEPIGEIPIDPNYKKRQRIISYAQARSIRLCPPQ